MHLFIVLLSIPAVVFCGDYKPIIDKLIFDPAKCMIPRDADNILRAALLQQCISPSKGKPSAEERCFGDLGCFPMKAPWTTNLRPFPQPMTPDQMDLQLVFYSRDNPKIGQIVKLWPNISMEGVDFDPSRPYTTLIAHGFVNDYNMSWIQNLKDSYLKARDANVFLVDWSKASIKANYLQVSSNTRVVGAVVGRFVKYLQYNKNLKPEQIHLIGHSLGAHIASYIAKLQTPKVAVLTALDPAQPGFEGSDSTVRVDKSDAQFVEAIHTSARPFIPLFGCGFITPVGHVDIYFNGGAIQPTCNLPPPGSVNITSIADLAVVPVEVMASWVLCSHNLAHTFYTEAISPDNQCKFVARKAGLVEHVSNLFTAGLTGRLTVPILSKVSDCGADSCTVFGLNTHQYPALGTFLINTNVRAPYCRSETEQFNRLEKALQEQGSKRGIFDDYRAAEKAGAIGAQPMTKPSLLSPAKDVFDKVSQGAGGLFKLRK